MKIFATKLTWSFSMRVALWIANMLKEDTLAGRKVGGIIALPSHLSPDDNDDDGGRFGRAKKSVRQNNRIAFLWCQEL